jgi:hypothetical protein
MFQPHDNVEIPCTTYVNTEDLLREVDEILLNKGHKRGNLVLTPTATDSSISNSIPDTAEPTAFTPAGKGKRSGNTLSQDQPDSAKYPRTNGSYPNTGV